jgi:ACT domain-containing protein
MPRRWVTAEDVRAAAGAEIVVDADTIVTPQALEIAESLGVTLRTASGAYEEPKPDRGPDASRAARTLPNLPEPNASDPHGFVVTVVGKNRPGVLAEITCAIADLGGNVNEISQRIIEGYFHLILTVALPAGASFHDAKTRLECMGGEADYAVRVMHDRVFHFMHRI